MMPQLASIWYLFVFALNLCGFALLALSTDREGEVLLGRRAFARQRLAFRLLGFALLVWTQWLCMKAWLPAFGAVMWFGWLTVAAVALVLTITYWPWRPKQAPRRARLPSPQNQHQDYGDSKVGVHSRARVGLRHLACATGAAALIVIPVLLGIKLWKAPATSIQRADALHGQIGPWFYVLAESNLRAPKRTPNGVFIKAFELRLSCPDSFTDVACESGIGLVYLRVRKPRNLRTAGNLFIGSPWRREVEIAIPPGTTLDDQIWLTIQATDGQVYHTGLNIGELSPATANFIKDK